MAKTFPVSALSLTAKDRETFDYLAEYGPEANSQTFKIGWPLKMASGKLTEWVSVADANIWGFALSDGQNATSGLVPTKFVAARPDLMIEANFLGSSAATNVLAATDLGIERDLIKNANLLGTSVPGWYIQDSAAGAAVITSNFESGYVFPDQDAYEPVAGDSDARIRAFVKPGVSAWY